MKRREESYGQSIDLSFFFLLKNQEAFFRNEGRPLEREKSPLHTRRHEKNIFNSSRQ
jgi:hypothetical protein